MHSLHQGKTTLNFSGLKWNFMGNKQELFCIKFFHKFVFSSYLLRKWTNIHYASIMKNSWAFLTWSHSLPPVFTSPLLSENTSAIVFISIAKFQLIDTHICDEKKVWSRKLSLELSLIEIHFTLFTKAGSFSFDINCLSSFSSFPLELKMPSASSSLK